MVIAGIAADIDVAAIVAKECPCLSIVPNFNPLVKTLILMLHRRCQQGRYHHRRDRKSAILLQELLRCCCCCL